MNPRHQSQVKFEQDVLVTNLQGKTQKIDEGQKVNFDNESILVESAGKVSVLLVPISNSSKDIQLKLKNLDKQQMNTFVGSSVNDELSRILFQINEVQNLLMEKKGNLAIQKIEQLQGKYKELEYLSFLKVSAYIVKGEREKAKQLLELSLQKYPDNKEGRDLYNSLFKRKGI
jgi:pectate lyase